MKRGSFFCAYVWKSGRQIAVLMLLWNPFSKQKTTHCKAMGGGGAKHLTFY